jgi:hypothetical protein
LNFEAKPREEEIVASLCKESTSWWGFGPIARRFRSAECSTFRIDDILAATARFRATVDGGIVRKDVEIVLPSVINVLGTKGLCFNIPQSVGGPDRVEGGMYETETDERPSTATSTHEEMLDQAV